MSSTNTTSKPSPAELARIKAAFSTLNKGDLVQGDGISLVVIRLIEGKGAVLGQVCPCGKHIYRIPDTTFSWSDEKMSLVDSDGDTPKVWSYDWLVDRGAGMKLAEQSSHIPITADYYEKELSEGDLNALLDPQKEIILKCSEVLELGADFVSMRKVLELIGLNATEKQAMALTAVFLYEKELKKSANAVGGLSEILNMLLAIGSSHHQPTQKTH